MKNRFRWLMYSMTPGDELRRNLAMRCDGMGNWRSNTYVGGDGYHVECRQGRCRLVRDGVGAGPMRDEDGRVIMERPVAGTSASYTPERLYGGGQMHKK